jgi:hypothetical protein
VIKKMSKEQIDQAIKMVKDYKDWIYPFN